MKLMNLVAKRRESSKVLVLEQESYYCQKKWKANTKLWINISFRKKTMDAIIKVYFIT